MLKTEFRLGQTVATPGALKQISGGDILLALHRHSNGDWGNVCEEDKQANDDSLKCGARILSSYMDAKGTKFWIITEADRSVTTILLPEEY